MSEPAAIVSLRQSARLRYSLAFFATQFKVGLLTLGGGVAMIPFFRREIVARHQWATEEQFLETLTTALAVPGPLAVSFSTVFGWRTAGLPGAIAGFLGVVTPSIALVAIVAMPLQAHRNNPLLAAFLQGAGLGVVGLVTYTALLLGRRLLSGAPAMLLSVAMLVAVIGFSVHPLIAFLCTCVIATVFGVRFSKN